jgi:hypothetical protein
MRCAPRYTSCTRWCDRRHGSSCALPCSCVRVCVLVCVRMCRGPADQCGRRHHVGITASSIGHQRVPVSMEPGRRRVLNTAPRVLDFPSPPDTVILHRHGSWRASCPCRTAAKCPEVVEGRVEQGTRLLDQVGIRHWRLTHKHSKHWHLSSLDLRQVFAASARAAALFDVVSVGAAVRRASLLGSLVDALTLDLRRRQWSITTDLDSEFNVQSEVPVPVARLVGAEDASGWAWEWRVPTPNAGRTERLLETAA